MRNDMLQAQNVYLRKMLEQAGLDAQARDITERIQKILTDEIHHRMKNMLAMTTAIVRQSMRSATSLAEAEAAITTRLMAMSKAHDLLLKANWKSAGLVSVIRGAIEQHNTAAERISVEGRDIEIASASILPLTLILNELCTNATKYGALSKEGGRVTVSWAPDEQKGVLALRWIEKGGPPVTAADNRSFGSRLIEDALPRQLDGNGRLSFAPSGVAFDLTVPLEKLRPLIAA